MRLHNYLAIARNTADKRGGSSTLDRDFLVENMLLRVLGRLLAVLVCFVSEDRVVATCGIDLRFDHDALQVLELCGRDVGDLVVARVDCLSVELLGDGLVAHGVFAGGEAGSQSSGPLSTSRDYGCCRRILVHHSGLAEVLVFKLTLIVVVSQPGSSARQIMRLLASQRQCCVHQVFVWGSLSKVTAIVLFHALHVMSVFLRGKLFVV